MKDWGNIFFFRQQFLSFWRFISTFPFEHTVRMLLGFNCPMKTTGSCEIYLSVPWGWGHVTDAMLSKHLHVSHEFLQSPKMPLKHIRAPKRISLIQFFVANQIILFQFLHFHDGRKRICDYCVKNHSVNFWEDQKVTFATKQNSSVFPRWGEQLGRPQPSPPPSHPCLPHKGYNCEAALPSGGKAWEGTSLKKPQGSGCPSFLINCSLLES